MKHVKFHLNRFLRRVRIHGGEFDTSARAMYRDEVVYPLQAELRIVRGSTIERKQMSTKTTFKRIALVTVAALGFGVMSVVPSSAVINADSLTLSAATAAQNTAETQTATSAVATLSFLPTAKGDSMSVTASLVSGPAGNTALPYLSITETASAGSDSATVLAVGTKYEPNTAAPAAALAASAVTTVKYAVYIGTDSLTAPSVAGTYVVKLTPALKSGTTGGGNATAQTLTITVTTAPALDPVAVTATSIITTAADTTSATDVAVTAIKTASTSVERAIIKVSPKNAALGAATESYTAIVKSGPGLIGEVVDGAKGSATFGSSAATARVIAVRSNSWIAVYSDGAAGVSTIEIQSKAGVVLATETMTFYGAATAITATAVKPVVGVSNSANAILVTLKDAAGTTVTDVTTLYVTSSDKTKITGTYTADTVAYSSTNGLLKAAGYLVDLTAIAAGTAKITVGTKASAVALTGLEAAPVDIRVGSTTPASVSVTLDKSSYIPGEKATISVVLKDATGLILADGTYTNIFATGGITASYSLGAGSDTTTATSVDAFALGVKKFSVYMPIAETDVKFSWTTGAVTAAAGTGLPTAAQGVAGSITVAVSSPSGTAATAAAEEALAAASDAFDAALTAAEAAEMAQSIAQEALDSVASLRKRMNKRFNAIEKLIKRLL